MPKLIPFNIQDHTTVGGKCGISIEAPLPVMNYGDSVCCAICHQVYLISSQTIAIFHIHETTENKSQSTLLDNRWKDHPLLTCIWTRSLDPGSCRRFHTLCRSSRRCRSRSGCLHTRPRIGRCSCWSRQCTWLHSGRHQWYSHRCSPAVAEKNVILIYMVDGRNDIRYLLVYFRRLYDLHYFRCMNSIATF